MSHATFVWLEKQAEQGLRHAQYRRLLPIVRRTAMKLAGRVPGATFSELAAWGWLGALASLRRHPGDLDGEELDAYAAFRVESAAVEAIVARDPSSHAVRAFSNRVTSTIRMLSEQLERAPRRGEIVDALGMTLEEYERSLLEVATRGLARLELLDGSAENDTETLACSIAASRAPSAPDLRSAVTAALKEMPDSARDLFELHYAADMPLPEAGACLGLDETRAVQLHAEAIHRLRASIELPHGPAMPEAVVCACDRLCK